MRNINIKKVALALIATSMMTACTKDFDDLNTNPNDPENANPALILSGLELHTLAEDWFTNWRGNLIFSSRFANQYSLSYKGSWFAGDDYAYSGGWTDDIWNRYFWRTEANFQSLLKATAEGGKFPSKNLYHIGKIVRGFYYQRTSDMWGDIPYSEAGNPDKLNPKYDSQQFIYNDIMASLKAAVDAIDKTGVDNIVAQGDIMFKGDMQQWKKFANTLRLRMALKSYAVQPTESSVIIKECLTNGAFFETTDAFILRPPSADNFTTNWAGIWFGFGETGSSPSEWIFTDSFINALKDNNDPRLGVLATKNANDEYVGITAGYRPATEALPYPDFANYSHPVINKLVGTYQNPVPTWSITASEAYFLRAEAALLGFTEAGDANTLFRAGIAAHMNQFGVEGSKITSFLSTPAATLSGTADQKRAQVYKQLWVALINNGYEAWALVRRTDMFPARTDNVNTWISSETNGEVPGRLRYPTNELNLNGSEVQKAVSKLSKGDKMNSKVWWDVK